MEKKINKKKKHKTPFDLKKKKKKQQQHVLIKNLG